MKIKIAGLALIAAMTVFNTVPVMAEEDDEHYMITNDSGVQMVELYVSAGEEKKWGDNLLSSPLKDGESGEILFAHDDERCIWDMATKDEHGNAIEWRKIDLCKYTKITLKPNGVAEYQ